MTINGRLVNEYSNKREMRNNLVSDGEPVGMEEASTPAGWIFVSSVKYLLLQLLIEELLEEL